MMKKLLFTLMLLLTAGFTLAARQTPPPEIVVTPNDDSYTITTIGQGEIHITCSYYDFETGEYGPEEEIQLPLTISRTGQPKQIYITAYAKVVGEQQSYKQTEYLDIPPLGDEIPPAPEITVTQLDNGWDGFYYVVSAVGDGDVCFFRKQSNGSWERANDDYEGHPCFFLNQEINIEQLYQFKAYQKSELQEFYIDDEHRCYYSVRGPETRWEYVVPGIKSLNGDIIFQMAAEGLLSVIYTGNEEVIISVTINDNPVELVDGKVHLVPGENIIHATVSAEGYINSPLEGWHEIYWIAPTPKPQIIVTPGDQAYTVQAIGEGEVHLRCDHDCDYHHLNGEVENPVTISRTQFDEFFSFEASACLGEGYVEAYVSQDVWVPALGATPMPDIVFTEDETGCEVRAVGQGELHLYLGDRYHGQEVENPYRIPRPYQQDYYSFEAYAQAEGQWESEVAWETIEVTPSPSIEVYDEPISYSDPYGFEVPEEAFPAKYTIHAIGEGTIHLYMNGEEVNNPFTISNQDIDEVSTFTATATENGKLTGDSYEIPEIAPLPKLQNIVTITYDEQNCYLTAEGEGYIKVFAYHYDPRFDVYGTASDEGEGHVVVPIQRIGIEQWKYRVECRNGQNGELLFYDAGSFVVPSNLLMGHPWIHVSKELVSSYEVSVHPWIIYGGDMPSSGGVKVNYGTALLLDGEIVESPYLIQRPKYGSEPKSYHFTAKNTLELQRYAFDGFMESESGQLIPTFSVEPIETIQMSGEVAELTVDVPAELSPERGDDFCFSYESALTYNVHCINNGNPNSYHGWTPSYAEVGNNKQYDSDDHEGVIPSTCDVQYYDIEYLDGRLQYQPVETDPSFYRITWMEWGGDYPDGGPVMMAYGSCPVTAIADDAFLGNTSLTGVEIGKNVTSIGKDAFKGCSNLAAVTCMATEPPTMTNAATFDAEVYNNATLQVPESSLEKYKTADWWRNFKYINGIVNPHLPGDLNGDGEVGIADVNALVDAILAKDGDGLYDVNGDGEVTIADVTALINLFLSSH